MAAAFRAATCVAADAPDFAHDVSPILAKYCAGCHNATDREGELSLESFADLQQGGEKGAVVVPGRADASLMMRAIAGEVEPSMPPPDNPRPTEKEIDLLRAWIEAGAAGPEGSAAPTPVLKTPQIAPAAGVKPYLTSLALSPDGKRLALGGYQHVQLVDPATRKVVAATAELNGKVNGVAFSQDGSMFVASSGVAGLYGVATICRTADASTITEIKGHRDAIYDAELSPDGKLLATCSYDRMIHLWDVASGKLVRSFAGHNGAVYDLAFSSDGAILASASADATVKIWNVATGERLDTLGQPEAEESAVAFAPDLSAIVAGGSDRQLRLWSLVSRAKAEINPLKLSGTAHKSPIVQLAFSPDGQRIVTGSVSGEVVLWDAGTLTPLHRYETQPDVVTGLAFAPNGKRLYVGRINGSWRRYSLPKLEVEQNTGAGELVAFAAGDDPEATPPMEAKEQEPNNSVAAAGAIGGNAVVTGVIAKDEEGNQDVDMFRFHANNGQQFVLEIEAARKKSPLDSKLEVLDAGGKSIPRVVLQAVRSSYYTFRGHDSTDVNDFRMHGAIDMEPNEYVYANGEVMKLWLLPRGPDSGFLVFPGAGANRYAYFGSTAITHALNEPVYVVEPHRPDENIIPNGLPVYTKYYENDDDGLRMLGSDSRVAFTAPRDGDYFARVSDIRGMGGDDYKYKLTVRSPRPDFNVKITAKDLMINAGGGKEFTVTATRKDEFDGDIEIRYSHLPRGFHVTAPLVVQAGQTFARGTITADADAPALTPENAKLATWTASATIGDKTITKKAKKLGELKLGEKPKVLVRILPSANGRYSGPAVAGNGGRPTELSIAPGETIAATLKVERHGFDGEIKFGTELAGRNLPHGVYVDNIGLNGITLLKGENERTIFLTARKWVPEQTRPFHLTSDADGKQTSWPVVLHVTKRADGSPIATKSVAILPETN
jgi:WD40 repeat protein